MFPARDSLPTLRIMGKVFGVGMENEVRSPNAATLCWYTEDDTIEVSGGRVCGSGAGVPVDRKR
jgi:hypothetical protein